MSKLSISRIRARKRALPDWMADDDSNECEQAVSETANESGSDKTKFDQPGNENGAIIEKKKKFVRPNYEYLPGNKHNVQARENCASGFNPEVVSSSEVVNADDIVANSMPFLIYDGSVIYSYNKHDCCMICEDFLQTYLNEDRKDERLNVGFDLEWPVTYQKGEGSGKVALLQLSSSESKCYLFHLSAIGSFPKPLKTLIEDDRVKKIGVNIENDMWKLAMDYDFDARKVIRNSMIDLGKVANEKLKSKENWSLDGLCRNVLRMKMNKDSSVRCGKWDEFPLTEMQKSYAATDTYACIKLFNILNNG